MASRQKCQAVSTLLHKVLINTDSIKTPCNSPHGPHNRTNYTTRLPLAALAGLASVYNGLRCECGNYPNMWTFPTTCGGFPKPCGGLPNIPKSFLTGYHFQYIIDHSLAGMPV